MIFFQGILSTFGGICFAFQKAYCHSGLWCWTLPNFGFFLGDFLGVGCLHGRFLNLSLLAFFKIPFKGFFFPFILSLFLALDALMCFLTLIEVFFFSGFLNSLLRRFLIKRFSSSCASFFILSKTSFLLLYLQSKIKDQSLTILYIK